MKIETIADFEKALQENNLLKKYNLPKIGIFGSFARGEKANDIDIYIDTENYSLRNLVKLKSDLEKTTQKEIDIMVKEYANPIVLYRAKKEMKYVAR